MRYTFMEANYPPEELFSKAYSRFYESLKNRYLYGIEKANDKAYAQEYYFQILFTENTVVPRYSVFFHSLISTFNHYRKVDESNSLQLTISRLSTIQELTSNTIEQTMIILSSLSERFYQLNRLYLQALEENHTSILELIDTEQRLLKFSDEKIVLLLALDKAVYELKEEFSPIESEEEQPLSEPLIEGQLIESKLTRSQQVLIAYYISQLLGGKQKRNISKCTDALHSFLGIPYTKITHSELYKKLLRPLTFSSVKTTLQNLEIVRSFFENLELDSATSLIDTDIEMLKGKLNN
jgi:hypothetical protein